jgi:hypothetical protein
MKTFLFPLLFLSHHWDRTLVWMRHPSVLMKGYPRILEKSSESLAHVLLHTYERYLDPAAVAPSLHLHTPPDVFIDGAVVAEVVTESFDGAVVMGKFQVSDRYGEFVVVGTNLHVFHFHGVLVSHLKMFPVGLGPKLGIYSRRLTNRGSEPSAKLIA